MDAKELKPLFDYLDDKFADVDVRFNGLESDLKKLQTSIDQLAKDVKDFRDEHIILYRRLETLESWAKMVSKKVGIPLPN